MICFEFLIPQTSGMKGLCLMFFVRYDVGFSFENTGGATLLSKYKGDIDQWKLHCMKSSEISIS